MKKTKLLLLAVLTAQLLSGSLLMGQWSQTNGPFGGVVRSIVSKGSKVIAGTEDGIFASNNAGISWFASGNGIPAFEYRTVSNLMVKGNDIFAAIGNKLYKSADNGNFWSQLSMTGMPNTTSSILALAYNNSYMFASFGKIFRSSDNGETWTPVSSGLPSNIIATSLAANDGIVYAGSVSQGVFVSTDNGATWSAYNAGLTSYYVSDLTIRGQIIHAATYGGGIFTSPLNVNSWSPANNGFPVNSGAHYVHGLSSLSNVLFAVTGNGFFRSVDNAASWQPAGTGLPSLSYSITGNGADYFAATVAGVYKSQDGGLTWAEADQNITSTRIRKIAAGNSSLFAAIEYKGIARSLNSGVTWDYLSNGVSGSTSYTNIVISGNNIIVTPEAVAGNGKGMLISTDNGDSWSQVTNGVSSTAAIGLLITEGDDIYGTYGRKVIFSTDNGESFAAGSDIFALPYATVLGLAASPATLYAATSDGLFTSQDKGITWDSVAAEFPEPQMLRAFACNNGALYISGFSSGSYYSTNDGVSWIPMSGLPGNTRINTFAFYEDKIFAGSDIGVLISSNNGQTWQIVNNGLTFNAMHVNSLVKSNTDHLFISSNGAGVWKSFAPDFTITGIGSNGTGTPVNFVLQQNYPNPFNPVTKISYQLPQAGFVSLKVYDLAGKEVAVIVNELQNQGNYSVSFNASLLSSGIYFYTINAGGFTDTKKMVLLK